MLAVRAVDLADEGEFVIPASFSTVATVSFSSVVDTLTVDDGGWLCATSTAWRQRGLQINVGVVAWGGRPVAEERSVSWTAVAPQAVFPFPTNALTRALFRALISVPKPTANPALTSASFSPTTTLAAVRLGAASSMQMSTGPSGGSGHLGVVMGRRPFSRRIRIQIIVWVVRMAAAPGRVHSQPNPFPLCGLANHINQPPSVVDITTPKLRGRLHSRTSRRRRR